MISALQFVIVGLAVFRVVRLLIEDDIFEPLRERTTYKLDPRNKFRELVECPWCLSMWLSVPAVLSLYFFPAETTWVALVLAFSAVTGLIAEHSE